MDIDVQTMRKFLITALEGAGVANAPSIRFDPGGEFFSIESTGIEVAKESGGRGADSWRVREVYEVADLREGGHKATAQTIGVFEIGDELQAARCAVLRIVELRLDSALDAVA